MAGAMSLNFTSNRPPLPTYELKPLPPLVAPIPDKILVLILPIVAYWVVSLFFHWIDENNYFAQYRLHTPAEILKRNRVTRYEVVRDVIIQQIVQTFIGWIVAYTEPDETYGKEEYDVAVWAIRIRAAQKFIPALFATVGLDATGLAHNLVGHPVLSGLLSGGQYPLLDSVVLLANGSQMAVPTFATWEIVLAKAIYWLLIPAAQLILAVVFIDTWQYFLHRAMHMNKWLYTTFHSRHHRLYVPYAFGALYNHPFEGFLLDTLGAALAFKVAGLNTRQGMLLFTGSTIKTVDDHCGYSLPFDPLQRLTSNNAGYHDIHHQSWGVKTNFSQPFFTFWDQLLGTTWTGGDVSARYVKAASVAQKLVDNDAAAAVLATGPSITTTTAANNLTEDPHPYTHDLDTATLLQSTPAELTREPAIPAGKAQQQAAGSREQVLEDTQYGGRRVLADEAAEEREAKVALRRNSRKKSGSRGEAGLRGLTEMVAFPRRTGGILGMEKGQ